MRFATSARSVFTGIVLLSVALEARVVDAQSAEGLSVVFPLVAPRISGTFGFRKHPVYKSTKHHSGVDLAAPKNRHVRSVLAGTVVFAGSYGGYGKLVSVKHRDGYLSMYGHLNEILVNVGESVKAGNVIGRVGSTGISTGPHLHFEWRRNGKVIDPATVLPYISAPTAG